LNYTRLLIRRPRHQLGWLNLLPLNYTRLVEDSMGIRARSKAAGQAPGGRNSCFPGAG